MLGGTVIQWQCFSGGSPPAAYESVQRDTVSLSLLLVTSTRMVPLLGPKGARAYGRCPYLYFEGREAFLPFLGLLKSR